MSLRPVNPLRYHVDNVPTDVAVDVRTSNTRIHGQGKGLIVEAPSVAVSNRDTGKAVTAGMAAGNLAIRHAREFVLPCPLHDGVLGGYVRSCDTCLVPTVRFWSLHEA